MMPAHLKIIYKRVYLGESCLKIKASMSYLIQNSLFVRTTAYDELKAYDLLNKYGLKN